MGALNDDDNEGFHTENRSLLQWFGLSILLHLVALLLFGEFVSFEAPSQMPERIDSKPTSFSVEYSKPKLNEQKQDDEKDKEDDQKKKQFVNMPPPEKQQEPEETKYRDQFESKAKKNQVKRGTPSPSAPPSTDSKPSKDPKQKPSSQSEQKKLSPKEKLVDESQIESSRDKKAQKTAEEKSEPAKSQPKELFPSFENTPNEFTNPSRRGSTDYLKDVPEGDKTLLNRKKSRYWTFFNRIKNQVAQEWEPVEEYRNHDPTGEIYGIEDRYSRLEITLESDGELRQLYLAKPSGLDFLDDEAIRSIRRAAPFRNPPEGLKDEDGLIRFSFGFYLDLNRGTLRALRLRNR